MDGYQLRAEIDPPHQSDVKAVLSINPTTLVTASRDQTVGVWSIQPDGQVRLASILRGHDAYVNSLAHIPPNANHEEDLIASGGNSSLILLHSLKTLDPEPVEHLAGHGLNVCALAYSSKLEKLISGSWDTTARVWSRSSGRWDTEVVLTGHEAAVWGVAILDEGSRTGCYLTGSADLMINLWNDKGEILSRFKGSPEPVRSIAICPGGETFISSCNDGLIRSWDLTGSITSVYKGHECYVYQVLYAGKEVVSCGEDHTARVWEEGVLKATISHPCQTVWSVGVLPDGDVVTGGSDGRIRIWTKEESRFAPEDIREAYRAQLQEPVNEPSEETDQVPKSQQLTIDIDISDDSPPIPLVFDPSSDPRQTAEEFGRQHGLSDNYINQIEAFIRQHQGSV